MGLDVHRNVTQVWIWQDGVVTQEGRFAITCSASIRVLGWTYMRSWCLQPRFDGQMGEIVRPRLTPVHGDGSAGRALRGACAVPLADRLRVSRAMSAARIRCEVAA